MPKMAMEFKAKSQYGPEFIRFYEKSLSIRLITSISFFQRLATFIEQFK